jgi:hypothetical protein
MLMKMFEKRLRGYGKAEGNLLSDVKAFKKASLAGEYFESFNVNSKNCMEKSTGTRAWIADCHRLLDRCAAQERKGDPADVRQAFETIFKLLDHIDECLDDVIFFADEAGSWQVGVDWNKILPPWLRALSATAEPEEYTERITALLERHYSYGSGKMLAIARRTATPLQRMALSWVKIDTLIAATQPKSYDQAVAILFDLRDLDSRGKGGDFKLRVKALRKVHAGKPSFINRLEKAGL